ncbi:leucine-rich repeat-containing protein 74b-like, partial [Plakobranchus ocellatus]
KPPGDTSRPPTTNGLDQGADTSGIDGVPSNNDSSLHDISAVTEPGSTESPHRSARGTRIPKISSRASFVRTPGRVASSQQGQEGDEGGLELAEGVLITELQGSDGEDKGDEGDDERDDTLLDADVSDPVDVPQEEEAEKGGGEEDEEETDQLEDAGDAEDPFQLPLNQVLVETVEAKPTEEDYDTDLEADDLDDEKEDPAVGNYVSLCEQLGLVPVEYFMRHIRKTNIRMRYRGLGSDATRAIALALKENISLERLDLTGNWIGAEGCWYMSRLLEENDYITEISIAENKLGSSGAMHVAKMMNINGGLRKLDIGGNDFDDKCAEALSSAIENNKYLRELNLSHNQFSEVGAEFLGPAISANENLDVLDLSWNHLRQKGGIAVAKGIKENVRLKSVNLSWNGLDAAGGLAIADALMVNQSLLEVDISGNRLTQEVAQKMAKVLTTNDSIKVLKMGNNLITSAGAIALASAINNTDNCEMEELDLTDVPVEYEFLRTVEDIRSNRPDFRVKHGPLMRAGNTLDDISKPAIDLDRMKKEPVVILKEHIVVNDLRLLDILKRYDEDNSLSISAEDFISALEELAVPYDKKRLQESVDKFASTATGKIYFGSFISDDTKKPAKKPS